MISAITGLVVRALQGAFVSLILIAIIAAVGGAIIAVVVRSIQGRSGR